MLEQNPRVELELNSSPEAASLVRGMLAGVGETLDFDAELLDDMKTAVSEACNNVAIHAYAGRAGALLVDLEIGREQLEVRVRDHGAGIRGVAASPDRMGVGLPVISTLSERAEFVTPPDGGTEVRMAFARRNSGRHLPAAPEQDRAAPEPDGDPWSAGLHGDVVARVVPTELLGAVFGPIARGLAARARFSVDRIGELFALTDALVAHAQGCASPPWIGVALAASERRLEVTMGPFNDDSCSRLTADPQAGSVLRLLADRLTVEPDGDQEMLWLVVTDQRES